MTAINNTKNMPDNISPEERLFKVIRQEKKNGVTPRPGPRGIKGFLAGLGRGRERFAERPRPLRVAATGAPTAFSITLSEIEPKTINRLLAITLAGLAAFVIHLAVNERPSVTTIVKRVAAIPAGPAEAKAIEAFKPMNFYLAEVEKRDIFQPVTEAKLAAGKPKPQKVALDKLREIAAGLKLQGISWGQSPKAMVKSENEEKMYFLGEGQTIGSTGVKVKAIHKNKIVISYENVEMELL